MQINNSRDLREAVKQGSYAWPGAYPLYFLMEDGAALKPSTVRANYKLVLQAVRSKERGSSDWRAIALEINYEDTELYDAHTNEKIESAYGEE